MDKSNVIPFEPTGVSSELSPPTKPFMKSSLINKASEIIEDPLVLINAVSQRVTQLNQGRTPLIPTVPSMGAADIALTEIILGKVIVEDSEDTKSK